MNERIRQLEADLEHFELQLAELNSKLDDINLQLATKGAVPFSEKTDEEKAWYGRARAAMNFILRDQRAVKADLRRAKAALHEARQPTPSKTAVEKLDRLKKSADRQQILVRCLRTMVGETAFFQACEEAESIYVSQRSTQQVSQL